MSLESVDVATADSLILLADVNVLTRVSAGRAAGVVVSVTASPTRADVNPAPVRIAEFKLIEPLLNCTRLQAAL